VIFVDTNVIVDVLQDDERWAAWSIDRLCEGRADGDLIVNAVVVAELSRDFPHVAALRTALARFSILFEHLDDIAAFLAGQRFAEALRNRPTGGQKRPLPDFFIGAHAMTLGIPLLTRDPRLYRRFFPELTLITPETDHDD